MQRIVTHILLTRAIQYNNNSLIKQLKCCLLPFALRIIISLIRCDYTENFFNKTFNVLRDRILQNNCQQGTTINIRENGLNSNSELINEHACKGTYNKAVINEHATVYKSVTNAKVNCETKIRELNNGHPISEKQI